MVLSLARSVPRSARIPGIFKFHFSGGSISFWAEFLTYSERARRVLLYGVKFSSLGPNPARPEFREVLISIFPGGAFHFGPDF